MATGPEVWNEIFQLRNVLDEVNSAGFFGITSAELNQVSKKLGGPDARNLVKYDHQKNLPKIFQSENLSILPVASGEFQIGRFRLYAELDEGKNLVAPSRRTLSKNLEALTRGSIRSETDSIIAAQYSGMIDEFLGGESHLVGWGRHGSPEFTFSAGDLSGHSREIRVRQGVTIEVDAQYESSTFVAAFEAKRVPALDFHIRQLYYPFRALSAVHRKTVRTVFLTYSNGIFDFREYSFENPAEISSFVETRRKRFSLSDHAITIDELVSIAKAESGGSSHIPNEVTFPQANRFDRVIALVEILIEGQKDNESIAEEFGFDLRQSDYYGKAAEYLGLARRAGPGAWGTTELADRVFRQAPLDRNLALAELMLRDPTFNATFLDYCQNMEMPTQAEMESILISTGGADKISGKTVGRRVGTVRSWITWLSSIAEH